MNMLNASKKDAFAHNLVKRQDDDKTAKRHRARSGEGTVAYWRGKLFRNSYRDRQGKTVEIREKARWAQGEMAPYRLS